MFFLSDYCSYHFFLLLWALLCIVKALSQRPSAKADGWRVQAKTFSLSLSNPYGAKDGTEVFAQRPIRLMYGGLVRPESGGRWFFSTSPSGTIK